MPGSLAHGFASLNGGTTGGSGGKTVTVKDGAQLQAAINGAQSGPVTIYVDGKITPSNTGAAEISVSGRNNISIIGAGQGAEFDGIGIRVTDGSSNLIIQNLKIHHVGSGTKDAIGIEGPSKNIWIDHNELYSTLAVDKDYYDGLLDIKRGAEYITISNNYLHDHHKGSLVGYSDSDEGARYITYDHNVFENIGSRVPSVRDGYVHIYDNYFKDISVSGINLRMGAVGLIENNVFEDVTNPIVSLDSSEIGYWDLRNNSFSNVTWGDADDGEVIAGANARSTASYNAPYTYKLDATGDVKAILASRAGVGHLGLSGDGGSVPTSPTTPEPAPAPQPPAPPAPQEPEPMSKALTGTNSADTLEGGASNDSISGGGGKDRLEGQGGDDRISGDGGDDSLLGGDGKDTLAGGDSNDTLMGDAGDDTLDGGGGSDQLDGGVGNDTLAGGDSNDRLAGADGNDVLNGGAGKDTLAGGNGADALDGGDAADTLDGGAGDDRLKGGLGTDMLAGGADADLFVFGALAEAPVGSTRDVISDFASGDRIDLTGIDAQTRAGGDQAFAFLGTGAFTGKEGELHVVRSSGTTLVEGDVDGDQSADFQLQLSGSHTLSAGDFLL